MNIYEIKRVKRTNSEKVYFALGEMIEGVWTQLVSADEPKTKLIYQRKYQALEAMDWLGSNQ